MKAYTDIEQSKKLAEILPIESADHHYVRKTCDSTGNPVDGKWSEPKYGNPNSKYANYFVQNFTKYEKLPCWSLAALRACLPPGISIDGILYVFESHNTFDNMWVYEYKFEDISAPLYSKSSNEIDACVEIIEKLYKQKLL